MEKYSEYQLTDIEWLPQIPKHWNLETLRRFLRMVSVKNHPEKPLLSVTRESGVIVRDVESKEENHNFIPEDLSGYKYVEVGDFCINKMKSWQGSYGVSEYEGIVSPAYYICKLNGVERRFFSVAIRSINYVSFFAQYSKGIRVDQWDLSPIGLKTIPFFLPPLNEQHSIVSYLDTKCSLLDTLLSNKEKKISLLQEMKQRVIADAVTRGVNPNVKFKATNIPWLPEIPEHWSLLRNKSFMRQTDEKVGKRKDITLLSLTKQGVIVRDLTEGKGKFPKDFETYLIVKPNNLVFCLFDIDETPRTVGLVRHDGMLTGAYSNFEIIETKVLPDFAYYYYLQIDDIKGLRPFYTGLRKVVKANTFAQLRVPVPPLSEQRAIVSYIIERTSKIDTLIEKLTKEIECVKEYKQRLISDVVTGQVKVS